MSFSRRSRGLASVLVLGMAVWSGAAAAVGAEGPATGTWTMQVKPTADPAQVPRLVIRRVEESRLLDVEADVVGSGKRLVIRRGEPSRVVGTIDWNVTKGPAVIEIVSGSFDGASRVVKLRGLELHTPFFGREMHGYEATLSDDGKTLSDFHQVGDPDAPQYPARWVSDTFPTLPPEVEAAVGPGQTGDPARVFQQLSADYRLDGRVVYHASDIETIRELSLSSDEGVRLLAKVKLAFQDWYKKVADPALDSPTNRAELDVFKAKLGMFLIDGINDQGRRPSTLLRWIENLTNSQAVTGKLDRDRAVVEISAVGAAVNEKVRRALRKDYTLRHPGVSKLDPRTLHVEFKVIGPQNTMIAVRNTTGRDLHDCLVATHMAIDDAKAETFERARLAGDPDTVNMARLMGIDLSKAMKASSALDHAVVAYGRIDKGSINYVPLWPNGATAEFLLAQPEMVSAFAGGIDLWVGAAEGEAVSVLDLAKIRRVVEPLVAQMQTPTPTTTTAPRAARPPAGRPGTPRDAMPNPKSKGVEAFTTGSIWVDRGQWTELRVTKRLPDSFEARLTLGKKIIRDISGKIDGDEISWLASDVTLVKGPDAGDDNVGTIEGDQIHVTWFRRGKPAGTFTLFPRSKIAP